MRPHPGFDQRVQAYVTQETDAMKRTPRRADTTYPIAISDLIKSASKVDIINHGQEGDTFAELSDISGMSSHIILERSGNEFVIQDTEDSLRSILMERDQDGRLMVGYEGNVYHEFDRTGNVYSHSMALVEDIQKYGKINVDHGLMTSEELQRDLRRALTHDALSETEISDMESIRKTPERREYEEITEKKMIQKDFPYDSDFLTNLLQYGKTSSFKAADKLQAILDVFHMSCHPDNTRRNYANSIGASYEVAMSGLSWITDPKSVVDFSHTSRNLLEIQGLLQQIKEQGVVYFTQFLQTLMEQKDDIIHQVRHADNKIRSMSEVRQGLDKIEKHMDIVHSAVAKV